RRIPCLGLGLLFPASPEYSNYSPLLKLTFYRLTLPTRAALEWRRSRNGKAVPVLGLVMSCLAQNHRLLVEQGGMLMQLPQNSTSCASLLAGSGAAAPR